MAPYSAGSHGVNLWLCAGRISLLNQPILQNTRLQGVFVYNYTFFNDQLSYD